MHPDLPIAEGPVQRQANVLPEFVEVLRSSWEELLVGSPNLRPTAWMECGHRDEKVFVGFVFAAPALGFITALRSCTYDRCRDPTMQSTLLPDG